MTKILFYSIISLLILSCNAIKPKKVDTRETPINAQERARKNIKEGKGTTLRDIVGGKGATNYEFSTSNPMWRASLEILDFLPFATVDYSGGMIITDWYTDANTTEESLKFTIRFLSNEVRSDSLKIIIHKKTCKSVSSCIIKISKSNLIKDELRSTILRKAALFQKSDKQKK